MPSLVDFLAESNRIEGIDREPTADEINAALAFLAEGEITLDALCALQKVIAPGKPLRDKPGMNVQVGTYLPPVGGSVLVAKLVEHLDWVSTVDEISPWKAHVDYEGLHPFMDGNGRTGRLLWAWHMDQLGLKPFALPFLHRFYYQTLENSHG